VSPFENLLSCAGLWHGVNRLWTSPDEPPIESTSAAEVVAVLGSRFVRIDQTWAYVEKPQSGSLLVGFDPDTQLASVHWIDTFHMGRKAMVCAGTAPEDGVVDVRGTYQAPPGPDWGWRILIEAKPQDRFVLLMHNIHPDGTQDLAVHATYSRFTATV
jgi:hypothetical protein